MSTGDHPYYETVKLELEKRFSNMKILNNEILIHEGIHYIGLTIPVALVKRKKEQQKFILKSLEELLDNDYDTPTNVIIVRILELKSFLKNII